MGPEALCTKNMPASLNAAAHEPLVEESKEVREWHKARSGMETVVKPFEEERTAATSSSLFNLSAAELHTLRRVASVAPATRSYDEVRVLLNLLRGADLLLKLDEDTASTVANAMRMVEYGKGDLVSCRLCGKRLLIVAGGSGTRAIGVLLTRLLTTSVRCTLLRGCCHRSSRSTMPPTASSSSSRARAPC